MNTDGKTNTEYFKRTEIQKRVFLKKMYLWPIYQNYLDNNEKLVQNKYCLLYTSLMAKKAGRRLYYKQALKLVIVNLYLKNK